MSYQQTGQRYVGYPPPPPPQRRNWPWILGMVVLAVIILGAVAYVTDPNRRARSETTDSSTPDSPLAAAQSVGPVRTVEGGVFHVGVDVLAGRYKTPGPAPDDPTSLCYWARHKDDSGEVESIIANGTIEGPGSVTVKRGEFFELTGGCTWTKVS